MAINVSWPLLGGFSYPIPQEGEVNWPELSDFLVALGQGAQSVTAQKAAARVATVSPVNVVSASDYCVITNLGTPGPVSIILPAGVTGQMFVLVDGKGDAEINNITIEGTGGQTINGDPSFVIARNNAGVTLIFAGTNWTLFNEFTSSSSGPVARADVSAGTVGEVVYNDDTTGKLASEAQLAVKRGGTGLDNSAATGIMAYNAGTGSVRLIANADVDNAAAIAYSKLNILGAVVNADVSASAGIVYSKLALTGGIVNADINASAGIVYSKLSLTGGIVNADVNASAAIAYSKLALTASVVTGDIAAASLTGSGTKLLTDNGPFVASPQISGYLDIEEDYAAGISPTAPSSGALRLFAREDHKLYTETSSGIVSEVGSGSGGGAGSVNYIQSSSKSWDFEADTTGWNVFRDGSAVEDGTGGSPTLTVARNTATPLNGTADLKITKPSGNQQWSGTSIDVDVPRAYQLGAKCELSFLYDFSAQTAAGDWQFYIYDVDNATRITPANNDIPKAFGRISTSWDCTTSANYRLIIACVDSDTAGYDVFVDDVVIGPGKVVNGYPGSDWTAYTPTISNLGTGSTASVQGYWRRNGPDLFCRVTWVKDGSGGSGTSSVNISIPSGLTIDTTKLTSNGNAIVGVSSHYNMPTASQFDETNSVAYRTTTTVAILRPGTADFYAGGAIPSGAQVDMEFSVPIAEWAGGSAYLGQSDTQECVIAYNTSSSSGKALNTFNLVQFNTEEVDTANCFASNTFTARTAGYFRVDASVTVAPGTNFTRTVLSLFKNSATEVVRFYDESHDSTTQWVIMSGSSVFKLEAGDTISAHVYATGSGNYTVYGTANGAQTRITITRVSVDGSVIGFGAASATSMGLVKLNRYKKTAVAQSANTTFSNTALATFNNLSSSARYKLNWHFEVDDKSAAANNIEIALKQTTAGGTQITYLDKKALLALASNIAMVGTMDFSGVSGTVVVTITSGGSSQTNPNNKGSEFQYIMLEEIQNTVSTTVFD